MIAVTGASGFVGTRLCEHLRLGLGIDVRAVVHRPERAVRLARLDVELSRSFHFGGCGAVVHLAYATEGSARERRRGTAELARRAAGAARDAGARLLHVSTAAVWGFDATGVLDEAVPVRRTGHPYVEGKIDAEDAVRSSGAEHVILRPANVWGPWAPAFTAAPVAALRSGHVALVGDGAGPANLVYVDNLAHAIRRALETERVGATFVIADDGPSWRGLYDRYASLLGTQVQSADRVPRKRSLLRSAASQPALRAVARRVLGRSGTERMRARIAAPAAPSEELELLQTCGVAYRTDKARTELGYSPPVDFETGMHLTEQWLRFARLI